MALILAAVAVLAALLATWALFREPARAPAVTFVSIAGEPVSVARLAGRVAVVSFWATDCAVCLEEMPELVRTYERYRARGLELVAVAMQHDRPDRVADYARRHHLPFKVALDVQGAHARAFGDVRATPTTFLLDRRGGIAMRTTGPIDFARLDALIERALAEPAPGRPRNLG